MAVVLVGAFVEVAAGCILESGVFVVEGKGGEAAGFGRLVGTIDADKTGVNMEFLDEPGWVELGRVLQPINNRTMRR